MSHNSSHLRTNSINFSSTSEDKQAALVASKHSKCSTGDVRLFTLSESSRFRPVRTRSVTSNILDQQQRRNGTETWRRPYCQCEHLRLTTHEKILLNGDVPRRNGNVTYSVNQPLGLSVSDPSHAEVRGSNSARGMDSTKSAVMSAKYCLAMSHFLSKMSYQMRKSNLASGISHERSTSRTRTHS